MSKAFLEALTRPYWPSLDMCFYKAKTCIFGCFAQASTLRTRPYLGADQNFLSKINEEVTFGMPILNPTLLQYALSDSFII